MIQTSIFDVIYPKFKIDKPIRLISLFSGYDSQALALKYLGVPFEHYRTCEWSVKSIQALKDLHFGDRNIDYSMGYSKEQLVEYLYDLGISSNYNEPMSEDQIKKLNEKQLRNIFNNIIASHNMVNIQNVKAEDMNISHTDIYIYILTYSFPCQDLSLSGKRKGMSDTSTRSGMLWEVERILDECVELPQVLVMENVPQVHGEGNSQDFNKWQLKLESLGYKNYWEDLIATDYGIPQTRNRCFMISILGEYSYSFPPKQKLNLKLKDMLEDQVSEKYFLSDRCIKTMLKHDVDYKPIGLSPTLTTELAHHTGKNLTPKLIREIDYSLRIKNATKKGYLNATNGDGIDISSRMEHHRGNVQKGKIQTLTTQCDRGVVDNLKIRKLTPKECFRLMGVKDEDFEKIAKNQSDSSLYHLAGDSIVVNVLMAIFREML